MKQELQKLLFLGVTLGGLSGGPAYGQESGGDIVRIGPIEIHEPRSRSADRVFIGRDILIQEGETNHDVVVILGDAQIEGTVTGDLVVVLGNITVGPSGQVQRDMILVAGQLEADPNAQVKGLAGFSLAMPDWLLTGMRDWLRHGVLLARPLPHRFGLAWGIAAAMLVLYLLISVLFPKPVQGCFQVLEARPATSLLAGFLGILLLGPLVFLLVVSVVGTVLVPFLLCACGLACLFGKVVVYRYAGHHFGAQTGLTFLQCPLVSLLVGALFFYLVYMIPILGFLVWGLVAALGFGATLLGAVQVFRVELPLGSPAPDTVPPVPVKTGESSPDTPAAPVDTTYLPRAGFWIRLAATLLDAVLIFALVATFRIREVFLPVWIAYHLSMWNWKATTIGGLVFGLKIVRVTGEPICFSVALVRCLSAIFSSLVCFLGFFWAGWNRDRQSWHDIIAGTVIVRFPKGTPLI